MSEEKTIYTTPFFQVCCINCQKNFETRIEGQKRCPQCIDEKKEKADFQKTVSRKCVKNWICKIELPREKFQTYNTGNSATPHAKRAIFRGKDGGQIAWNKRMDVFLSTEHLFGVNDDEKAYDFFPSVGRVRLMEVEKKVGNTIKYEDTGKEISFSEKRQYLAIDLLDENEHKDEIEGNLIYEICTTKYTLKGLGRQYSARYDQSQCLWSYQMACSCRSGRIFVYTILAIVNEKNPLIMNFTENGETETTYYPESAKNWVAE